MAFNKVIIVGNLVADIELKTTPSGVNVISFALAVNRRFTKAGEQAQTDFIDVVAWREKAEFVSKYFKKGMPMLVCGELQSRMWQDKDGNKRKTVEVVADDITFVERKSVSDSYTTGSRYDSPPPIYAAEQSPYGSPGDSVPKFEELASDDDLPF